MLDSQNPAHLLLFALAIVGIFATWSFVEKMLKKEKE